MCSGGRHDDHEFYHACFCAGYGNYTEKAVYGYYVDEYQKNGEDGIKDTLQNPAIGVLSEMLDYFTPGTAWDNGTILNSAMHEMNLKETAKINQNSTQAEKELAFYDDLHDGNYSMISGLGIYADEFKRVQMQKPLLRRFRQMLIP